MWAYVRMFVLVCECSVSTLIAAISASLLHLNIYILTGVLVIQFVPFAEYHPLLNLPAKTLNIVVKERYLTSHLAHFIGRFA